MTETIVSQKVEIVMTFNEKINSRVSIKIAEVVENLWNSHGFKNEANVDSQPVYPYSISINLGGGFSSATGHLSLVLNPDTEAHNVTLSPPALGPETFTGNEIKIYTFSAPIGIQNIKTIKLVLNASENSSSEIAVKNMKILPQYSGGYVYRYGVTYCPTAIPIEVRNLIGATFTEGYC